jgi:hypothetical protein
MSGDDFYAKPIVLENLLQFKPLAPLPASASEELTVMPIGFGRLFE